ncbi:hypothetical protein HMPREF3203_02963 [Proteus mirabilis]|nr:hypothetical protein HMPREF3203_02963 [Proteus mirabilis]
MLFDITNSYYKWIKSEIAQINKHHNDLTENNSTLRYRETTSSK